MLDLYLKYPAEDTCLSQTSDQIPFQYAWSRPNDKIPNCFNEIENITSTSERAIDAIKSCYHLLRRKASEVMVWVLTNIDRNSSLEVPCFLTVAYNIYYPQMPRGKQQITS